MSNRQLSTLRYSRDTPSAWLPTSSTTAHLKDTESDGQRGKLRHEPAMRQKDKWGLNSFGSTSQMWPLLCSLRPSPAPRSSSVVKEMPKSFAVIKKAVEELSGGKWQRRCSELPTESCWQRPYAIRPKDSCSSVGEFSLKPTLCHKLTPGFSNTVSCKKWAISSLTALRTSH